MREVLLHYLEGEGRRKPQRRPGLSTMSHSAAWEDKNPPANAGETRDMSLIPGLGRSRGEGDGNLLQYFLPGKFHGQKNLAGYSPRSCKELDTTEYAHAGTHARTQSIWL